MNISYERSHKLGRPRILDGAFWKIQFPEKNYRQLCSISKCASVWKVLLKAAGENVPGVVAMGPNAKTSRPKTFKRWPWLMGDKIQHTVLAEMYGCVSNEYLVSVADYVEKERRRKKINAKQARKIARDARFLEGIS